MNRYNELKLQVLSLFAATQGEWLGPNEAAEKLNSFPALRLGRISKDYGASACWKGVPEVEVLWNIGLAN
jgi:hypothetical protein